MIPPVTVSEFKERFGINDPDDTRVQTILSSVWQWLEFEITGNRGLEVQEVTWIDRPLLPRAVSFIFLPRAANSITAVYYYDGAGWQEILDFVFFPETSEIDLRDTYFVYGIKVVYQSGFETCPADLKEAFMQIAFFVYTKSGEKLILDSVSSDIGTTKYSDISRSLRYALEVIEKYKRWFNAEYL